MLADSTEQRASGSWAGECVFTGAADDGADALAGFGAIAAGEHRGHRRGAAEFGGYSSACRRRPKRVAAAAA